MREHYFEYTGRRRVYRFGWIRRLPSWLCRPLVKVFPTWQTDVPYSVRPLFFEPYGES